MAATSKRTSKASPTGEQGDPIVLRAPRSAWWILLAVFAVVVGFTVGAFVGELSLWYKVGYMAFCCLFPVAFAELAANRIILEGDTLTFIKTFRKRVVHAANIESVTWAKGAGVSLRLTTGEWVRLPLVAGSGLGLTNCVRAWVKRAVAS